LPYLEVPTRGRNFAEGGPLASKQGSLDSTEKKVEKYTCMRMWISILKPEIAENHSEKGTKQQAKWGTQNQRIFNTEVRNIS